ncbi:MFS transporter [Mycobacterium uberis]|uniref:MFS transporter n=1 Tax=Mycobacterium uberis TaxID=2162698 RepID=A0A3E1HLQ7_9MYCO|nr:MFS transporter [Mycobacterium uberis]RFD27219.1 MFS transporter [Mycobacterium uberis]
MTATTTAAVHDSNTQQSLFTGRVMILLAVVLSSLPLRSAITSLTPLLSRVSDNMGFGNTIIGIFGMLPTAVFALAGFISPALGRRFTIEQMALVAAATTAAGIVGRSMMSGVTGLLALTTLALIGMGIGNIVIPPLVKRYFGDRVALMSTVYLTCIQLGTLIPAAAAVPLADTHGWRVSLAVWALIPLAALGPWTAIIITRRGDDIGHHVVEPPKTIGPVWRSPIAWSLTIMLGMTSLITYTLFTWIPEILTSAGGSESLGGAMVAVFSGVGFVAALVAPALCVRLANPFPIVIVCACCYLFGFAGLLWAPLTATIIWVLFLGLGPTTFPAVLTLINLRCHTGAGSAALSGFTQGVGYLIACVGPLLFGVLHDVTKEWVLPFGFLLVTIAALLVGGYYACKPRYLEDSWVAQRSCATSSRKQTYLKNDHCTAKYVETKQNQTPWRFTGKDTSERDL